MCGILGLIRYGNQKIDLGLLRETFVSLSARGTDASGFYFERENTKRAIKAPVPADELWDNIHGKKSLPKETEEQMKKYRLDGTEKLIIMHTRAKTRGTPQNNYNNMPIHSARYVLAHNGHIYSSRLDGYNYQAEVDSEEILARVEKYGIHKGIKKCEGSMAILLKRLDSRNLYFGRRTNPLSLVWFFKEKMLIILSASQYVKFPEEYEKINELVFGGNYSLTTPSENTLYKVSLDKIGSIEKVGDIEGTTSVSKYWKDKYGTSWHSTYGD
ncbi:MAG: hypothetical protein JRI45_06680 [Deltaproteobacteria bacterium]|nr:hypothetical protein [Deltaproteobacteria bacterium]